MRWAIGAGTLAVAGCLCALLLSVRATVVEMPRIAVETRGALLARVDAALGEVHGARVDAARQASAISAAAQTEVRHGVDGLTAVVDAQAGELRGQVLARVDALERDTSARTEEALAIVRATAAAATPVLTNSAALVKDAQDSWDDSYWDVKALVGSATVATTQASATMQEVRQATPVFLANAQRGSEQAAGIVTDVHTVTTQLTAPKTLKQKIVGGLKIAAMIAARLL